MMVFGIEITLWLVLGVILSLIVAAVVFFFILLQLFIYMTTGVCKSTRKMNGKTVIITGCTSGIGKETARDLAHRGARLIMACRNVQAANKLKETFRKKTTEDGLEMTMATNQYGPFLLTHLLIDLLKRSKPSRVVVVASELYRLASLNLDNLNPVTTFPAYLYYVSKYANIVFSLELARRLEGTGVTVNCLHPELEGVTGKYFLDCREYGLSSGVQDPAKGKKFWELSETIVKLQPTDPKI
ncbi:Similar to RDH11: Retinol dehydrogenase 11 (Homo sapiens), partial [Cotesia congregata]